MVWFFCENEYVDIVLLIIDCRILFLIDFVFLVFIDLLVISFVDKFISFVKEELKILCLLKIFISFFMLDVFLLICEVFRLWWLFLLFGDNLVILNMDWFIFEYVGFESRKRRCVFLLNLCLCVSLLFDLSLVISICLINKLVNMLYYVLFVFFMGNKLFINVLYILGWVCLRFCIFGINSVKDFV